MVACVATVMATLRMASLPVSATYSDVPSRLRARPYGSTNAAATPGELIYPADGTARVGLPTKPTAVAETLFTARTSLPYG